MQSCNSRTSAYKKKKSLHLIEEDCAILSVANDLDTEASRDRAAHFIKDTKEKGLKERK